MSGRRRLPEPPPDPARIVRSLRACRDAVILDLLRSCRPFSPAYKAGHEVLGAIGTLADMLTGRKDYFFTPGHGGGERAGAEWKAWLEWEEGKGPKPN